MNKKGSSLPRFISISLAPKCALYISHLLRQFFHHFLFRVRLRCIYWLVNEKKYRPFFPPKTRVSSPRTFNIAFDRRFIKAPTSASVFSQKNVFERNKKSSNLMRRRYEWNSLLPSPCATPQYLSKVKCRTRKNDIISIQTTLDFFFLSFLHVTFAPYYVRT